MHTNKYYSCDGVRIKTRTKFLASQLFIVFRAIQTFNVIRVNISSLMKILDNPINNLIYNNLKFHDDGYGHV